MFFTTFMQSTKTKKTCSPKKDLSNHLRILLLAIRLQRLVKSLPSHLVSAERINYHSLSDQYLSMQLTSSHAAALKMAGRDLKYINKIFGLEGSERTGYVMGRRFDRYDDMFTFWLDELGTPSSSNRRMHVLLQGLKQSIENGFRDDPIAIPQLAHDLKKRFGNKNIRDSKKPLEELFSNHTIASYLQLMDEDDEALRIDLDADPLLMRLKSRDAVGDNAEIAINLALPSRIRSVFHHHLADQEMGVRSKLERIAQAVNESSLWQNEAEDRVVPYILYRESTRGDFMLTLWNCEEATYYDLTVTDIQSVPTHCPTRFIPYGMQPELWRQFIQITA